MRPLLWLAIAACSGGATISATSSKPLPTHEEITLDQHPHEVRRVLPAEAYLRTYLQWFGGLAPQEVERRARPGGLFDTWREYLAALGLPDYKRDIPRQDQTNTLMVSTFGRLGEALCVRAAEHDLHGAVPVNERVVFKFETGGDLDQQAFTQRFDVLHRKFLGYPVRLAPPDRVASFFELYQAVAKRHGAEQQPLRPDEAAWAAVCTALVQHPEAELY